MDNGIPIRLHQLQNEDLENEIDKAKNRINAEGITLDSQEYKSLLLSAEVFKNFEDRQRYFRSIFMEAMKNGNEPVYPIRFPA